MKNIQREYTQRSSNATVWEPLVLDLLTTLIAVSVFGPSEILRMAIQQRSFTVRAWCVLCFWMVFRDVDVGRGPASTKKVVLVTPPRRFCCRCWTRRWQVTWNPIHKLYVTSFIAHLFHLICNIYITEWL